MLFLAYTPAGRPLGLGASSAGWKYGTDGEVGVLEGVGGEGGDVLPAGGVGGVATEGADVVVVGGDVLVLPGEETQGECFEGAPGGVGNEAVEVVLKRMRHGFL